MNRCYREAEEYVKNIHKTDFVELQLFINKFNSEIEKYSVNGLSSYLLNGIELCLKLSRSIGYVQGEAKTKWLKGYILFIGGLYRLALKSYAHAIDIFNKEDCDLTSFYSSFALNLICRGEMEKSLEVVQLLINGGDLNNANSITSYILQSKGESLLSLSLIDRLDIDNNINTFHKINTLLDLNRLIQAETLFNSKIDKTDSCNFMTSYIDSLGLLIKAKKGEKVELDVLENININLKSKKIFFYYIEGLLNIAEIYIEQDEYQKAYTILSCVIDNKKDLAILDYRLYKLLEALTLKQEDYKEAYKYSSMVTEIVKSRTTFNIDKTLREMAVFLYPETSLVS